MHPVLKYGATLAGCTWLLRGMINKAVPIDDPIDLALSGRARHYEMPPLRSSTVLFRRVVARLEGVVRPEVADKRDVYFDRQGHAYRCTPEEHPTFAVFANPTRPRPIRN